MYKHTKIVATIGPSSDSVEILEKMIREGLDVARLNFSHNTHEYHLEVARNVRYASGQANTRVAILQDLQGPKLRIGQLKKEINVKKGDTFSFVEKELGANSSGLKEDGIMVPIDNDQVLSSVKKGHEILIEDGKIVTRSIEDGTVDGKLKVVVENDGIIKARKTVNFPDSFLKIKTVTDKDEKDLEFAIREIKPDFVAQSFVQKASEVLYLKDLIKQYWQKYWPGEEEINKPHVIVKIEKPKAFENIEEIIKIADGIMVGRGDLGTEMTLQKVPIAQKELVKLCHQEGKPVVIATEMLASMENNPKPTRAEISDVANAVIDRTDAVMLSNESSVGKYPIECVKTMTKVIKEIEQTDLDDYVEKESCHLRKDQIVSEEIEKQTLARSAVKTSKSLNARAIVTVDAGERLPRLVSKNRPDCPIIAITDHAKTANRLVLGWAIRPFDLETFESEKLLRSTAIELVNQQLMGNYGNGPIVMVGFYKGKKGIEVVN